MISTKTNLIILESVGSKGQANNCVNAQHHSRFIRACDQATSSVKIHHHVFLDDKIRKSSHSKLTVMAMLTRQLALETPE